MVIANIACFSLLGSFAGKKAESGRVTMELEVVERVSRGIYYMLAHSSPDNKLLHSHAHCLTLLHASTYARREKEERKRETATERTICKKKKKRKSAFP